MPMTIEDLTGEELRDLLSGLLEPTSDERKAREHVKLRYDILHDRVSDAVSSQWIIDLYDHPEIAAQVIKHKMRLHNPIKRVVDRLAVLYQRKPRREIRRNDRRLKEPTKQWEAFLKPMLFDKEMRKLNRYAIALNAGVGLIRPRRSRGRVTFDVVPILKSISRAVLEPEATVQDPPGILAWLTADPNRLDLDRNAPVLMTADSRWLIRWDRNLNPVPGTIVEHGLGRFPGATFRNTLPDDEDPLAFWDPWTNAPIVDAHKHVFRIVAEMNWTRKTQAAKIITATMNDQRPKGAKPFEGQVMADRDALLIAQGEGVQVMVHDFTTLVDGFKGHLDLIQDVAMEILTGTVSTFVAPDPGRPLDAEIAKRMQGALRQHQADQVDYFDHSEQDIAEVFALWGNMLGLDIPRYEVVRDGFYIGYQELPSLETLKEQLEVWDTKIKLGTASAADIWISETGETLEEAKTAIKDKLEEQAEFNDIRTKRHLEGTNGTGKLDEAKPGERPEAVTGRVGGEISRRGPAEATT